MSKKKALLLRSGKTSDMKKDRIGWGKINRQNNKQYGTGYTIRERATRDPPQNAQEDTKTSKKK